MDPDSGGGYLPSPFLKTGGQKAEHRVYRVRVASVGDTNSAAAAP